MTFDAREATAAAEAAYPPFPFIGMDGTTYHLPHPLTMKASLAKQAQAGLISFDDITAEIAPEAAAALDEMSVAAQRALVKAWRESIDPDVAPLGKELRPSSPTQKSGGPSKRTSRSVGKTSGRSPSGE